MTRKHFRQPNEQKAGRGTEAKTPNGETRASHPSQLIRIDGCAIYWYLNSRHSMPEKLNKGNPRRPTYTQQTLNSIKVPQVIVVV